MSHQAVDITPSPVDRKFAWSKASNLDQFEQDWSMKIVKVRGIFDHTSEIAVEKNLNGEKGFDVITPFYTHLNEKGDECGLLVNRGWVPKDLYSTKNHYTGIVSGEITGLLYRGDNETKYSKPNEPTLHRYTTVRPRDFALITKMNNREEASQFMLKQIDTNEDTRQILPTIPTKNELTQFKISPERHEAYATMWKYLTFVGVFANTALWLYF